MTIGVITHVLNPTAADVRTLAREAEDAGADWFGVPDAFWWRDSWLLLAAAAEATSRIRIGPVATNPYLRHPYHTVAAVGTLQEVAGPRVFVGLAAGGSEVSGAAGQSRRDAPRRIGELADLIRDVAAGRPLDEASGRTLEVPLTRPEILVAGRGDGVLSTAGAKADQVLLWAIPTSDLRRSTDRVRAAATDRPAPPALTWAPLVARDDASRERIRSIAAYSVLNSSRHLQQQWGLAPEQVQAIRTHLVRGGAAAATSLVPPAALDDLVLADPAPAAAAAIVADHGVTGIAIPAFATTGVADQVAWAREVLAAAG